MCGCVFPSDVSPTGQGVDHRQVQRELGEVAVQLQEPITLTTASIRVSWTVSGPFLFREGRLRFQLRLWNGKVYFFHCISIFPHSSPPHSSRLTVSLSTSRATGSSTAPAGEPGSSRTSTPPPNASPSSPACSKGQSMR